MNSYRHSKEKVMRIALTGATGFIGSAVLEYCRTQGVDVVTIGRLSGAKLSSYVKKMGPFDGCIHMASQFVSKHEGSQIPSIIRSNVTYGTQVLESLVKSGCGWFLNVGTFWQRYDAAQPGRYSPVNLYAATKQAFQDILFYYHEAFNIRTVTLELTDTYGAGDKRKKLMNLWCGMARSDEQILMSSGNQEIELIHRDDVVNGCWLLANLLTSEDHRVPGKGEVYFLPTSDVMTLRSLAKLFETVNKCKLPIVWGGRSDREREIRKIIHVGTPVPGWKQHILRRTLGCCNLASVLDDKIC